MADPAGAKACVGGWAHRHMFINTHFASELSEKKKKKYREQFLARKAVVTLWLTPAPLTS